MIILEIKNKIKNKQYDDALDLIEKIPEEYMVTEIFILKGICIQLSENLKYELCDAELSFKKALELEPNNIDAKLELGWLYFNVLEQSKQAEIYFHEAMNELKNKIVESLEGDLKINLESEKYLDLNRFLKDYSNSILFDEKLQILLKENEHLKSKKTLYSIK